jgi:SAM-dependent methyltransferase
MSEHGVNEYLPALAGTFDRAAKTYADARPGYPAAIFDHLATHCGLAPGARVLEIGAGSGQATLELLRRGATVTAVEPGDALAAELQRRVDSDALRILVSKFEDVQVPEASFDLVASATAFHWVQPDIAVAKSAEALRVDGWLAIWATLFGDPERPDPFRESLERMLAVRAPNLLRTGPASEALPVWLSSLQASPHFGDIDELVIFWEMTHTTDELRSLFASFSPWIALPDQERASLLDSVADIADSEFAGAVTRPYRTILRASQRTLAP